jgi:hypothetical protein
VTRETAISTTLPTTKARIACQKLALRGDPKRKIV